MEQLSTDKKMNQIVFWPAIIALAAFIFYGVFFQIPRQASEKNVGFILAVGGGSVIDCYKIVSAQ